MDSAILISSSRDTSLAVRLGKTPPASQSSVCSPLNTASASRTISVFTSDGGDTVRDPVRQRGNHLYSSRLLDRGLLRLRDSRE